MLWYRRAVVLMTTVVVVAALVGTPLALAVEDSSGTGAEVPAGSPFSAPALVHRLLDRMHGRGSDDGSDSGGVPSMFKSVAATMERLRQWKAAASGASYDADDEDDEGANSVAAELVRHRATGAALHLNPASDVEAWQKAGSAAQYWGITPLPPVEIDIPLTIVPVGWDVGDDVLQQWLTHLEHHVAHAAVDLENRTAHEVPHVQYRYRTTVVLPGPELLDVVNTQLASHARSDAAEDDADVSERRVAYIEAAVVEAMLTSFVVEVGKSRGAPAMGYTLFLLNTDPWGSHSRDKATADPEATPPTPPFDAYGYRDGMAVWELNSVLADARMVQRLQWTRKQRASASATAAREGVHGHRESPLLGHVHGRDKDAVYLEVFDATEVTQRWAAEYSEHMTFKYAELDPVAAAELVLTGTLPVPGRWTASTMRDRLVRDLVHGLDMQDLRAAALDAMKDKPLGLGPDLPFPVPGCISETWVGRGRVAWVDLGAGPFRCGPIVGGRGVKTHASLRPPHPRHVEGSAKRAVLDAERDAQGFAPEDEEYELTPAVLRAEAETLAREEVLMEGIIEDGCSAPKDTPRCERLKKQRSMIRDYLAILAPIVMPDNEAEADDLLLSVLPQLVASRKVLFKLMLLSHDTHTADKPSTARALAMMPTLAAAVTDFTRRVVTPASALPDPIPPPTDVEDAMDMLVHHTLHAAPDVLNREVCDRQRLAHALRVRGVNRVAFRLLVVTMQDSYNPVGPEYLDIVQLRKELEQFRFSRQQVVFSMHNVRIAREPSIAMAYAMALRSATVPTLDAYGRYVGQPRTYIDSTVITHQLKMFVEHRRHVHDTSVLEIPIVLFSTNDEAPVFVDKRHVAWPACGMVVAVQSDVVNHRTNTQCNHAVYRQNLRNPVREIIAASLHVLGGLLPVHLGVGDDHRLHQSWLWSVGPSVLSRMSSSHDVTGFTRDAVQRNILVQQLSAAWLMVDSGIKALQHARTSPANAGKVHVGMWRTLLVLQHELQAAWVRASKHLAAGDFDSAAEHCSELIQPARRFYLDAIVASHILLDAHCEHEQKNAQVVEARPVEATPKPEPVVAKAADVSEGSTRGEETKDGGDTGEGTSEGARQEPSLARVRVVLEPEASPPPAESFFDTPTVFLAAAAVAITVAATFLHKPHKVVKPKLN